MKFILPLLFSLFSVVAQSQVHITAEQDQERNLTLFSFNEGVIPYTIQIQFSQLENLESLEGELLYKVAKPGRSTLVKLQSIYSNAKIGFRYNTQLYKGDFQKKIPFGSAYLIPLEKGVKVNMRPLLANQKVLAERRYTGVGFFFEQAAVVCAPRKGIVSEIKMDVEKVPDGPVDFSNENYVEIYHQDGSFTRLSGLKARSAKVEVGETVIPGQAIAESSPQGNSTEHHVKMIQSHWEMEVRGVIWVNFPVSVFSEKEEISSDGTAENLRSTHPEDLIAKELDKKELKKYLGR